MIFIASDMNDLAAVVFAVILDAAFLLLFIIALVTRSQRFLRFLSGAGAVLSFVVAIMHIPWWMKRGFELPVTMIVITVVLAGIVSGSWREVRKQPGIQPKSVQPKRPRTPEDW